MMWYKKRSFWQPFCLQITIGVILSILCAFSSLGLMASAAWLITSAAYQPGIQTLSLAIIGVRVFGIMRAAFRYAERYVTHDVTFRILGYIRNLSYEGLERLLPFRDKRWSTENVIGIFIREIDVLKDGYLRLLLPFLTATAVCLLVFSVWLVYVPEIAWLLLFLFIMVVFFIPMVIKRKNSDRVQLAVVAEQTQRNIYLDLLYGMGELLAYDRVEEQFRQLSKATKISSRRKIEAFRYSVLAQVLAEAVSGIALIVAFILLTLLIREGCISGVGMAVIVLVFQGLMEFFIPLSVLPQVYSTVKDAAQCIEPWLNSNTFSNKLVSDRQMVIEGDNAFIEMDNVSFSYDDGVAVLDQINFCLQKGEKVAIVGQSGAGKSTFCCLLLDLYKSTAGTVKMGNVPYDDLAPSYIRSQFGTMMQDMHLFDGSIKEFFYRLYDRVDESELWQALEQAGLAEYIRSLPQGLDALIGRHGDKLSGGQRQRLMLAAALLKKCPVLLLDEPGRGLDAHAGAALRRTIFSLPRNQSLILVTHDFTGLQQMDRIVVLANGKVVEMGTYRELLVKKKLFFQMQGEYRE